VEPFGVGATGKARTILGMPADHVIVASTTVSEEAARALAAGAIDARLGACAQIVGPITSVFRWKGEVQTEQEWRLEIKTTADRVTALTAHIKDNHSYDVPEIIATPITGGSAAYLSWLVAETRS
jgi:periplasmic divalent cation tolerance protein